MSHKKNIKNIACTSAIHVKLSTPFVRLRFATHASWFLSSRHEQKSARLQHATESGFQKNCLIDSKQVSEQALYFLYSTVQQQCNLGSNQVKGSYKTWQTLTLCYLKKVWHEIFDCSFFSWISFPWIHWGPFRMLTKIRRCIQSKG